MSSVLSEMDTTFQVIQTEYRLMESQLHYKDVKSVVRLEFCTATWEILIHYNYKYGNKKKFTSSYNVGCTEVNGMQFQSVEMSHCTVTVRTRLDKNGNF